MLRGLEVELVSTRQSLLQAEEASRLEHLHVQAGEVSPVPRSESASIGPHLQYAQASGARNGEGQKSAAHGASHPSAYCSAPTPRAGQANAFPNAADVLERNRRRLRHRRQRRQPLH